MAALAIGPRFDEQQSTFFDGLTADQNARLAVIRSMAVTEELPVSRGVGGELPPPLRDMLRCTLLGKQVPTRLSQTPALNVPATRQIVWEWLLAMDEDRLFPILLAEYANADTAGQHEVLMSMAGSGSAEAIRFLASGLSDDELRPACTLCLRYIGPLAEQATLAVLAGENVSDDVKVACCTILEWAATEASLPAVRKLAEEESPAQAQADILVQRLQLSEEDKRLAGRFSSRFPEVRSSLSTQLKELRRQNAAANRPATSFSFDELKTMLASADPKTQAQAASFLTRLDVDETQRPAIVKSLESLLDSPDPAPRWFALHAYGRWAGQPAVGKLSSCLADDDPYVVTAAATGLSEIDADASGQALISLLSHERFGFTARMALIHAGEVGSAQRIAEAVAPKRDDPNVQVRIHAATILARLGTPDGLEKLQSMVATHPAMEPIAQSLEQVYRQTVDLQRRDAARMRSRTSSGGSPRP